MPALPIAAWISIAGLATTVGEQVYSKVTAPDTAAELKKEQQASANQKALTERNAVVGQQGNVQAATGGALTDAGFQEYANQLAGYPGYKDTSALTSGTTSTSGTTGTTGTTASTTGTTGTTGTSSSDITALLNQLNGGTSGSNISGGTTASQPQSSFGRMELSAPFV